MGSQHKTLKTFTPLGQIWLVQKKYRRINLSQKKRKKKKQLGIAKTFT